MLAAVVRGCVEEVQGIVEDGGDASKAEGMWGTTPLVRAKVMLCSGMANSGPLPHPLRRCCPQILSTCFLSPTAWMLSTRSRHKHTHTHTHTHSHTHTFTHTHTHKLRSLQRRCERQHIRAADHWVATPSPNQIPAAPPRWRRVLRRKRLTSSSTF